MTHRNIIRAFALAAGVFAVAATWGCGGHSFSVGTPAGFVVLDDQEPSYDYRATTADGVVIGIREIKHEPKGDDAFWVQAVKNQMRAMAGYALLDTTTVATKGGLRGTQMKFGHDEKGEPLQYTVTVFVTEKKIYVVEFGGTKAQLDRLDAQMKWVIESFQAG